jgi:hypothetical protein
MAATTNMQFSETIGGIEIFINDFFVYSPHITSGTPG